MALTLTFEELAGTVYKTRRGEVMRFWNKKYSFYGEKDTYFVLVKPSTFDSYYVVLLLSGEEQGKISEIYVPNLVTCERVEFEETT